MTNSINLYFTRGEFCLKCFCLSLALAVPLQKAMGAAAPFALTRPPTQISGTNATLNGAVAGNSDSGVAWFEVGTNTSYGFQTSPVAVDAAKPIVFLQTSFSGVMPNVPFHYRVVASNSFGITYGPDHIFAASKKVSIWGSDSYGRGSIPTNLDSVSVLAASANYEAALKSDGSLVVWGQNAATLLAPPPGLPNLTDFAAGGGHLLAINSAGGVTAWGANGSGQISVPGDLTGVVSVAAGVNHSLALKADGTVAAWGNTAGGLGTVASSLTQVAAIAASGEHSLALKVDGTVVAWGSNSSGESDVPPDLTNVVAIAAGTFHSLALKADGTVVAWGNGQFGQTAVPANLGSVVSIAAGNFHNLALKADGSVMGWGYGGSGQTTSPLNLPPAVTVAAGADSSTALVLDLLPVATSQMVDGPMDSDLTIALSATDPRSVPLGFKVLFVPSLGTLYQYQNGSRGPAITSANTVVTDPQGRVIFTPIPGGKGSPYATFRFRAEEAVLNGFVSDPAIISINIGTGPRPTITQFIHDQTGFTIGFNGVTTSNYSVLASSTPFNWTVIGSATLISNSFFQYTDTSSNAYRFFLIRTP